MFLKSMFFKIKTRVNVYCLQFFEPGRSKIVCFTDMASTILSEQWYKYKKENFNDAKVRTVTATTNLIKN